MARCNADGLGTSLPDTRDDSPLLRNLLLAKLLRIPPLPANSPRQHGGELVDQKGQRGHAPPATGHPEAEPLNPLAKVVREQHVLEQPRLGDTVVLHGGVPLTALPPADLAQLLVVEVVARQPQVEDGHPGDELRGGHGLLPRGGGRGPVGGQPAPQAGAVEQLEEEGGLPDGEVDGRDGRLQERVGHGSVEVVDDLEGGCGGVWSAG